MTENRGGARPGAGRKMVPRVAITVRLDPEVAYWINRQPMSQAKVIEKLVAVVIETGSGQRKWGEMGGEI